MVVTEAKICASIMPGMSEQRSILLLCDQRRRNAGNVLQHIAALTKLSRHDVHPFNPIDRPGSSRLLHLGEFDVIVIHYTIVPTVGRYLPPELAERIARFAGLKIQFLQDEYRRVNAIASKTREIGVEVLYTCIPSPVREQVYGPRLPGITTITTLPGLVPDELVGRSVPPTHERPVDVGYRARDVPYWLGRVGREKVEIGSGFQERAGRYGLRCDISSSEKRRIYGEAWNRFLASCKATLGTTSGASILDTDGSIETQVREYLVRRPDADFEEVESAILAQYEGNGTISVASPRLFEAAALRTAMILFPGDYSGVVQPNVHYIPLERDFSNMDRVVEKLRDAKLCEELTRNAYDDLVASGRYSLSTFVSEFDELVSARSRPRSSGTHRSYRRARLSRQLSSWRDPSRLRTFIGSSLTPPVTLLLVLRDGAVRRLAFTARDSRLTGDLWRLAALRRTARRWGPFHVRAALESEGRRLIFESIPGPPGPNGSETLAPAVRTALSSGSLDEILWNHSTIGPTMPLIANGLLAVPVGYRGVPGAYGFDELVEFSRRAPEPVMEALEPLL